MLPARACPSASMAARAKKSRRTLAQLLSGGGRRSVGRSNVVADQLSHSPSLAAESVNCLFDKDPRVRMRAADALEKASAQNPKMLYRYKAELLGLLYEEQQKEVRWHLAQMVPRLRLAPAERGRANAALREYLSDSSSIVRTFAMQALAELAGDCAKDREEIRELIRSLARSGTPAMRARGRKLLAHLEKQS